MRSIVRSIVYRGSSDRRSNGSSLIAVTSDIANPCVPSHLRMCIMAGSPNASHVGKAQPEDTESEKEGESFTTHCTKYFLMMHDFCSFDFGDMQ